MATLNFPEVWLKRVRNTLTSADKAPWLADIPELDAQVMELGSGDMSESNIIHIPTSAFKPDVLINNTTYPIAVQAYTDNEVTIQLDKYQTKATSLTDDQVIGASYDRIDNATRSHTTAILEKKYGKAIHAICPATNTSDHPVLKTTGTSASGQRKPLTYADLVALKAACDNQDWPVDGRRLVLCTDHWNDLLLDRANFGNLLVDYNKGKVAPVLAGFEIFQYVNNPYITIATLAKVAYGSAPGAGDNRASVAFLTANIAKKTGMTKQYFAKSEDDPENQINKVNYRHYFIASPAEAKYVAAIVSDKTA